MLYCIVSKVCTVLKSSAIIIQYMIHTVYYTSQQQSRILILRYHIITVWASHKTSCFYTNKQKIWTHKTCFAWFNAHRFEVSSSYVYYQKLIYIYAFWSFFCLSKLHHHKSQWWVFDFFSLSFLTFFLVNIVDSTN